jgi:predicted O-methyltransferase YrrM
MTAHDLGVGIKRRVRTIGAAIKNPPVYVPGHFYSPQTAPADRARAVAWRQRTPAGVELREDEQVTLAQQLAPAMAELRDGDGARYVSTWPVNTQFGRADAATLHAMLRHDRPARYLEVGSGFSTAVALDTVESHIPDMTVTCVEPHPDRLLSRLRPRDKVNLIRKPVQDVDPAVFAELAAGDVLFIDSTHVVKSGSDVVYLLLHILPTLTTGVLVHVHDIHWPFEYPETWLREGRDWTEVYLLRGFLTYNQHWRVRLMTSWLWCEHADVLPRSVLCDPMHTGSLWMQSVQDVNLSTAREN